MVAYQEVPAVDLRALWVDAHFISAQATKKKGPPGGSAAAERISEFLVTRCVDRIDQILPGDTFVALDMPDRDGHDEALQAIAAGAALVVCERYLPVSVPQCIVEDSRQAWGELCHALAGQPTDQLITIAIIGTHGKTTLNLLTSSMMKSIGQKIAYRNSLATSDGATQVAADDAPVNCPKSMAKWLSGAVQQQVPSAIIEIDTEMLYHGKTAGLQYDLIMLTSLRTEKVTETGNSDQLQQAIIKQFGQLKEHGVVLYNADDAPLSRWMNSLALPALAYGIDTDADVRGRVIERESGEQTMMITAGRTVMPLRSPLIGSHNARHLLGAVAAGYACGLELSEVVGGVEKLQRVPGRMQRVSAGQEFGVFVDQANTADRLAVALHAARQHSTGRVLCVMDISASTQAEALSQIGRVLEKGAAEVCLTHAAGGTFKSVQKNAFALLDGFENPALPHVLPDRDKAIEWILHRAKPGDVVLLAGCGDQAWSSKSHPLSTNDYKAAGHWLRQPKPELSQILSKTIGDSSFQEDISHSAPQPIRGDKPKLKLFRPE